MVMSSLVSDMVNNKGSNPICHAIRLLKDVQNRHHNEMIKKVTYAAKNWISLMMLCVVSDPIDDYDRIILDKKSLSLQLLLSVDNTCLSNTKLCSRNKQLKRDESPP